MPVPFLAPPTEIVIGSPRLARCLASGEAPSQVARPMVYEFACPEGRTSRGAPEMQATVCRDDVLSGCNGAARAKRWE